MTQHRRALPHREVADAIHAVLGSQTSKSAKLAFEFLVLTAVRSREVRLATWKEIDLAAEVWTVPAERIKAKREHRVPLSDRAMDISPWISQEDIASITHWKPEQAADAWRYMIDAEFVDVRTTEADEEQVRLNTNWIRFIIFVERGNHFQRVNELWSQGHRLGKIQEMLMRERA